MIETLQERRAAAVSSHSALVASITAHVRDMALTRTERHIIRLLLMKPGELVTSDQIAEAVWGFPADAQLRAALRSHIYSLRRKVQHAGLACCIETQPGEGLRLILDQVEEGDAAGS